MDLCKVKQRAHELAITVIMECSMDSVVVEREETARRCGSVY
jgi:chromosome segregation ATPase